MSADRGDSAANSDNARTDIPSQLGTQLVDTPQGQRLAITLTMLLPAAEAKQFAEAVAAAAASMSATRLVVANGIIGNGRPG